MTHRHCISKADAATSPRSVCLFLRAGHTRPLRRPLHRLSGKAETSDFFNYFCLESSDVLPQEYRCFHFPERHLSALPSTPFNPAGRGKGRKPEGKRERKRFFTTPAERQKPRAEAQKPALFICFSWGFRKKTLILHTEFSGVRPALPRQTLPAP